MYPTTLEEAALRTLIQLMVAALFILGVLVGIVVADIWRRRK